MPFFLFAQSPCESEEYHQFDFWIGNWDVYSGEKIVGTNRVEPIVGSCGIQENWVGASGSVGRSFNMYNPSTKKWKQVWVDNSGQMIEFEGVYKDGKMALRGEAISRKDGGAVWYKLTFTHNEEDDTVRQLWEASRDAGLTWATIFDGLYVRKK